MYECEDELDTFLPYHEVIHNLLEEERFGLEYLSIWGSTIYN